MIDARQIRAARALLDLSQVDLSDMASVSATTIKRLEGSSEIRGAAETIWKIQKALEAVGIEFIPAEGGKGSGVRLTRAAPEAESSKPKSKSQKRAK